MAKDSLHTSQAHASGMAANSGSHVRLGQRLSRAILGISISITLLATIFQVYNEYQVELAIIEARFDEIEQQHLGAITKNVWLVDLGRLQVHTDSLATVDNISRLLVTDEKGEVLVSSGKTGDKSTISRRYKLNHRFRGQDLNIGEMTVTASLSGIYEQLLYDALVFLVIYALVIGGISLLVYFLVYRLIGKPLEAMAAHVRSFSAEKSYVPLNLERDARVSDEIDELAVAFNNMSQRLINSMQALHKEVGVRKQAEQEVWRLNKGLEERVRARTVELEETRDLAVASSRAKSAFLDNMSHELRTPLNAILGFSQLLERDPELKDGTRESLQIILRNGQHLLELLNEILEMAGIESGRSEVDEICFSPYEVAEELVDASREQLESDQVELILTASDSVPEMVCSDGVKFQKILGHLLSNAIKFTREGRIALFIDAEQLQAKKVHLCCTITDTGIGIARDDLNRIFNFFTQAGEEAVNQGPGLGLAITRHYIDMLQGSIRVDSEPGKGSVFRVTIPVEIAEASVDSPLLQQGRVAGLSPSHAPVHLLIVDDQPDNRSLLRQMLSPLGVEISEAGNGSEAVDICMEHMPDLIWMDRRMPVMDGAEATLQIRQLAGGDAVKIIALTASVFHQEIVNSGHDDFIHKPFQPDEVFHCLAKHLGLTYLYEREALHNVSSIAKIDPGSIARLPMNQRDALREAVITLDIDQIRQLTVEIETRDAELAGSIRGEVDRLNMSAVLKAMEDADLVSEAVSSK